MEYNFKFGGNLSYHSLNIRWVKSDIQFDSAFFAAE